MNETFAERLTRLRKEQGLSVEQLSLKSCISSRTIARLERGLSKPNPITVCRLADALHCDYESLYDLTE